MFKKRRLLTGCLVFLLASTIFCRISGTAEAAQVYKSFNVEYLGNDDVETEVITVNDGDVIQVTIEITNNTSDSMYYISCTSNVTTGDYPTISSHNLGIWTCSILANGAYSAAITVNSGMGNFHDIKFRIAYNTTPPSGGGDSDGGSSTGDSDEGSSTVQKESESSHTHYYFWSEEKAATEDTDGEMVYRCECGAVQYRVPISAYYVFNKNTMEKIKKADKGATVKIETSKWISFHKMVMQALADRPDVSLEVSFLDGEYKGNRISFIIPAGTDTLSLLDDNGFAGFLYLAGKLGMTN
ncbi:hypothetical protein [Butyrivibrio sp. TB]|uniref:hypothetical protein n=1 Tax=Butyrivibrio sp. TB TaxID=1520809 RepID=UPI0008B2C821|nr:hypothetical protein [Butyrivibrio sp. TB]SEP86187.1 hypothetical protein SAMN02910382_01223 [Butyrivibrio sp. TB]